MRVGPAILLVLLAAAPAAGDLEDVMKHLSSDGPEVVGAAMRELPAYGAAAAPAVPRLALEIETRGAKLWRAVDALGKLGPVAAPAIPALAGLASGDHYDFAVRAIGDIGAAALPALRALLRSPHHCGMVAHHAVREIGRFGPAASEAVPDLAGLFGAHVTAFVAADALARIGPEGKRAPAEILATGGADPRDRAADPDARVRERCLEALYRLEPEAERSRPVFLAALADRQANFHSAWLGNLCPSRTHQSWHFVQPTRPAGRSGPRTPNRSPRRSPPTPAVCSLFACTASSIPCGSRGGSKGTHSDDLSR